MRCVQSVMLFLATAALCLACGASAERKLLGAGSLAPARAPAPGPSSSAALAPRSALAAESAPAAGATTIQWQVPSQNGETVIPAGSTVTWQWADTRPHDVQGLGANAAFINTSNGGRCVDANTCTGTQNSVAITFTQRGSYQYHCSVHPGTMTGTIVVV